jgi:hypothetical protein
LIYDNHNALLIVKGGIRLMTKNLHLAFSIIIILSTLNFTHFSNDHSSKVIIDETIVSTFGYDFSDDNKNHNFLGSIPHAALIQSILFLSITATNKLIKKLKTFKHFLLAVFYQSNYFQSNSLTS